MQKLDSLFQRYPLFRFMPAVLLLAMIFRTSSIDGEGMDWLVPPFDKFLHAGTFGALAIFFGLWFTNARWEKNRLIVALYCVGLCLLAGVLDEYHQSFVPGRSVSVGDIIADVFGGTCGITLYALVKPWKRLRFFREDSKLLE